MQPLEPGKLVIKFRTRLRIAVRQIDAADENPLDRRFNVARLHVVIVPRQCCPRDDRRTIARQDRDSVPGFLTAPYRIIACTLDRRGGEILVGTLQFLQADDVRSGGLEPMQQVWKALVDIVYVEGRDFHRRYYTLE